MTPNQKIKLLRISAVIIVAGLSSIQFYLIYNTYRLAQEKYFNDIETAGKNILNFPETDSLESIGTEVWLDISAHYWEKQLSPQDAFSAFKHRFDSLGSPFLESLNKKIKTELEPFETAYKWQYEKIVLSNSNGNKETLLSDKDAPILLTGNDLDISGAKRTGHSNYHSVSSESNKITNSDVVAENTKFSYSIDLAGSHYIDTSSLIKKTWQKIWLVFALAVSLILAVILLFYKVFESLITQKKIAEIQTDFANNITHELKTPLASLSLIVQSLSKKEIAQNADVFNSLVSSLRRQNQKIQGIVEQVLESAMSENAHLKIENIDLNLFLNQYLKDFNPNNHLIDISVESGSVFINTDTFKLDSILNNLLDNALKYSDEGTKISIESKRDGKFYYIKIKDCGKGIPPKERKRIFDKFYRISEGDRHQTKGLGLGLYLSSIYAKQLGGSITVESEPNQGSTFTLTLTL